MLVDNLLKQPRDCLEICLREQSYGSSGRADLIRDVMGLANLPGAEARYIVMGAHRDADGKIAVSGLDEKALAEIEGYAGLVRQYLEPQLSIDISCSSVQGKLLAVLTIDRCENPPYLVCTDLSQELKTGACWIREPGLFRAARRADLDRMFGSSGEPAMASPAAVAAPAVSIGFGDDPAAQQWITRIPDLSTAPSALATKRLQDQIAVVKAAGERDVADSSVARLVHTQQYGSDLPYDERGVNTLIENFNAVPDDYHDADAYYFRESNALKLNFSICNNGEQLLEDISVIMTMPMVDEFAVVEKLCPVPGRSEHESDLLEYPAVTFYKGAAQVRQDIEQLHPGHSQSLYETALRVALRPAIAGKKIALRYALHARGLHEPQEGVLKLVLKG